MRLRGKFRFGDARLIFMDDELDAKELVVGALERQVNSPGQIVVILDVRFLLVLREVGQSELRLAIELSFLQVVVRGEDLARRQLELLVRIGGLVPQVVCSLEAVNDRQHDASFSSFS